MRDKFKRCVVHMVIIVIDNALNTWKLLRAFKYSHHKKNNM